MKLYKTTAGWAAQTDGEQYFLLDPATTAQLTEREDLLSFLTGAVKTAKSSASLPGKVLAPLDQQEVWAAGVTYFRSRDARMAESKEVGGGDFYRRVYDAARPELFFKATKSRVSDPEATVRIRKDSKWNVPEPELALLVSPKGTIVGYTIGNDMSSRDIEGENPLYLPQAKVYDQCCALGPAILVSSDPLSKETQIRLDVRRAGANAFNGSTTLASLKRDPKELVEYLFRDNIFPGGTFLLTGTGIIPPDEFTLQAGDEIEIAIDGIGSLRNVVI